MQRRVLQFSDNGGVTLAETPPPIENLVFGGGGVRGVVYPGAIHVMKQRGMLQHVKRVAGSSSGALSAVVIGLGYTPDEFEKFSRDLNKSDFVNSNLTLDSVKKFFAGEEKSLGQGKLSDTGMFSGDQVYEKIQSVIRAKMEEAERKYPDLKKELNIKDFNRITFQNLHDIAELHPDLGFKEIFITGTNKTDKTLKIFSHNDPETRDVEVALAVRISMSIPVLYQTVVLQGKEYEDGGSLNNFPIEIFDQAPYLPESKSAVGDQGQNLCSFGLKVDTAENMQYLMWHDKQAELEDASFIEKMKAGLGEIKKGIFDAITDEVSDVPYQEAMRKQNQGIRDRYQQRVLQIGDQGVGTMDFDVTDATKQTMLQSGRDAATSWCDAHQGELRLIASGKQFKELVKSLSLEDLDCLCKDLRENKVQIVASNPEIKRIHCMWVAEEQYRHLLKQNNQTATNFFDKTHSAPKKQEGIQTQEEVKPRRPRT